MNALMSGFAIALSLGLWALPAGAQSRDTGSFIDSYFGMSKLRNNRAEIKRLKQKVAYLSSLSLKDMLAIVPAQAGIYFTDCPNCDKSKQDRGNFVWQPEKPGRIVCKDCGAVYPNNPKYPDSRALEVKAPGGVHSYPYYESPPGTFFKPSRNYPSEKRYRLYFRAHADYWARIYMENQCCYFARLYTATKEDQYAERAAAILVRFAEVYPGYALHYDYPFRQKIFLASSEQRVKGVPEFRSARWSWWAYMDIAQYLVEAYAHIHSWPHLRARAGGKSVEMIEQDLLAAMVGFVLGFRDGLSNMSPGMWRNVVVAGRVLGRPEWVHEGIRRFERILQERFLYDGHWFETSPSYCQQVVGGFGRFFQATSGYCDPPGYIDAVDKRRFDQLDLTEIPAYEMGKRSLCAPRFPDARLIPLNDTWSRGKYSTPRESMHSVLLPGLGVAVMGGGRGTDQLHVYLNFTGGRHHKHYDAMSFGLFAFGKELFPDIGYTHTKYRPWCISSMSHNTVVVDGKSSQFDSGHTGNKVRVFASDRSTFHVVEAENLAAYPGVVTRYRRTLVVVGADSSDCYVVDVFQVVGGTQHDYLLHGSADEDSTAHIVGAELKPFSGTLVNKGFTFVPPAGESANVGREGGYGFVHSLRSVMAEKPVALDMRLSPDARVGTRSWLMPEPKTEIFAGQAPSVRRARESDSRLDNYHAPFFCARRKGKDLKSVFVAVHEPVKGHPRVQTSPGVRRSGTAVLVTIDRGPLGRDYAAIALDAETSAHWDTPDGKLTMRGRYAWIRTKAGRVREAHIVGTARLKLGRFILKAQPGWSGKIVKVERKDGNGSRGYFRVRERIPETARGLTLLVTHADDSVQAYNIVRADPASGTRGTRLSVLEDPGFRLTAKGGTEFVCYPLRTIKGRPNRYEILNTAHAGSARAGN